ncbi:MAG: Tm-1-like ATP-binding domain-containing protein, partial [Burkholderiales bacterium]|nr:Tm-1-like ATP-binding domain-containing protein [Burkholderiales bacterium]
MTTTVLIVGTVDTKSDEIACLRASVEQQGARAVVMDVGVLGRGGCVAEIANAEVAAEAGATLAEIAASGDENSAMALMALGASRLARRLHAAGRFDGLLALGGTMATDLALDVAAALPLGVPKVVLSTIAHSHLIPPERIAPDLMMRLWAGGLYGLNRVCRSALAQAAGAAVGACRAAVAPAGPRPVVGMTSLGSSALSYMKTL